MKCKCFEKYQFLLLYFTHSCTADTISSKIVFLLSFVTCVRKNRQHNLTFLHFLKKMSNCEKG